MANVREQVRLSRFTTLGLGGPARRFVVAGTDEEIIAAVRDADQRGEPLLVLGGGSNLVISDDGFPGTVVQVATKGIHRTAGPHDTRLDDTGPGQPGPDGAGPRVTEPGAGAPVTLTVAAGEEWDTVVASCVATGVAGLESLSGIPGLTGATPIQNVGAYGQEVADTITRVRAYDRARAEVVELAARDCGFGYRTSAFKRSITPPAVTGRFVVLGVTFQLVSDRWSRPVRYAELAGALGLEPGHLDQSGRDAAARAPLGDVRSAVLRLRRGKGMVLDPGDPESRSAGSFFTNPILDAGQFARLRRVVDERSGPEVPIPQFPAGPGQVKVPAAWLIGQAGFQKGYQGAGGSRPGPPARISTKHTLALVNPGGASTAEVVGLGREIRDRVHDILGVELASEPVLVGVSL
ncbi:MAG: UDP-N-acetylmuramate dehydrogenase [Streptosporangiaceae bacterium]